MAKKKLAAYDWFCWVIGLNEHISDILARQKERMGIWWWGAPILTIVFTALLLGFEIWLLIHIVTHKVDKWLKRS